jgi:hypothetical protein
MERMASMEVQVRPVTFSAANIVLMFRQSWHSLVVKLLDVGLYLADSGCRASHSRDMTGEKNRTCTMQGPQLQAGHS